MGNKLISFNYELVTKSMSKAKPFDDSLSANTKYTERANCLVGGKKSNRTYTTSRKSTQNGRMKKINT